MALEAREEKKYIRSGETKTYYPDPCTTQKFGQLAHADGSGIPEGSVELDVVKSEGNLGEVAPIIDAEGADSYDELDPETPDEALQKGGRELVDEYIQRLFHEYNGDIHAVGKVNEKAMGHRVTITRGRDGYAFAVPAHKGPHLKEVIDSGRVAILRGQPGTEFSPPTGLDHDVLEQNGLGFTRKITMPDNRVCKFQFFYLKAEGYLGGEKILEEEKKYTFSASDLKDLKADNSDEENQQEKTEDGADIHEGYFGVQRSAMAANENVAQEKEHDYTILENEMNKTVKAESTSEKLFAVSNTDKEESEGNNDVIANDDIEEVVILGEVEKDKDTDTDEAVIDINVANDDRDVIEFKTSDPVFEYNIAPDRSFDDMPDLERKLAGVETNSNQASNLQGKVHQTNNNLF